MCRGVTLILSCRIFTCLSICKGGIPTYNMHIPGTFTLYMMFLLFIVLYNNVLIYNVDIESCGDK